MNRILLPATAFPRARQRRPRVRSEPHLDFIRQLPCVACKRHGTEAAHIRSASPKDGKRETGKAEKPSDRWTLPLCNGCHRGQHSKNELAWWANLGIDPFRTALALWGVTGDLETGTAIVLRAGE